MDETKSLGINPWILLGIILIEGFATISVEILTMRQLLPIAGSGVVVTSLIIGVFLLFLALGYRRGGQIDKDYRKVLISNFTKAAVLIGIGLSYVFVVKFFAVTTPLTNGNVLAYLVLYLMLITSPLVYFLGQTVPITTNMFKQEAHIGAISGKVLYLSTIGSFMGAVGTSLVLMNFLGVAWTVVINFGLLFVLVLGLSRSYSRDFVRILSLVTLGAFVFVLNVSFEGFAFVQTNQYANYRVYDKVGLVEGGMGKMLSRNASASSFLNDKKQGLAYIELLKKVMFDQMKLKNKEILVLGSGGFTLSAEKTNDNHFTYNDIDGQLPEIVTGRFIKEVKGDFVAGDARNVVSKAKQQYDAIISDSYNSPRSAPAHLLTREHFENIREALKDDGFAIFNIIANPTLQDAYSKRVDNTLRTVFGNCMSMPLEYSDRPVNIVYICKKSKNEKDFKIYTDNKNSSTLDFFSMTSGKYSGFL